MTAKRPINWTLIDRLKNRPHPLINIPGDIDDPSVREILIEARNTHHLLDLINIPHGKGDEQDLDARMHQAVTKYLDLNMRLGRIITWHAREDGPSGLVGKYCRECEQVWPCDTLKLAQGTYEDPQT